ncbi:anti-sigma factor [Kribbella sp. CA-294648]|uniref:anti-sigma factor n=1 Tax=Kribbella sp. CA-294648 TaxID=3239948 RepID=UPI003D92D60E
MPAHSLGLDTDVTEILRDDTVWKQPPAWLEAKVTEQLRESAAPRSTNVVPLRRRLSGAGGGVRLAAAAAALLASAGAVTAVLAGSRGAEMTMAGTALAQGASAKASVMETVSGIEFALDVDGLPPAPADSYYQGWVKGSKGLVSIGTFHLRGGSKNVVLWSGVSPSDYPTVTVTLQHIGEGPASSGRIVLTGDIPDLTG